MKLIDALNNVIKEDWNHSYVPIEDLCSALNMNEIFYYDSKLYDESIKMYGIQTWICTDELVGVFAIYFKDELVGVYSKFGRKCSCEVLFLDRGIALNVKEFLESISREEETEYDISTLDPDQEIRDFYSYEFASYIPIPNLKGIYNDREIVILDGADDGYLCHNVIIKYIGEEETEIVDLRDIKIPILTQGK